ncbi:Dimer-Tnp-hAT multi-domain protein [Pyrenophora tritici-repentis]|uniref:Dimer-Tnp-hAT multi-domain protein n=1 Tax=Pyrenophora tritici-repentis TaxID=45151 RepID=A0A922T1Y4_9PLEO|nr:Dimer-Tnp-hAT multi-domain protein [Pyrenophora tritici-repentis]
MDSDPFVLDVRLNGTDFVTGLVDSGCLCYSAINEQLFRSLRLPSIKIAPRQLEEAAGKNAEPSTVLDTVTYASIDIDGHQQKRVFFYVVPGLTYDVILGKPWLEDADVTISAKQGCLDIGASNIRAWNHKKASYKPPLMKATQVMASAFMAESKHLQSVQIQSLSSEEIDFTEEIRMFEDQDMQNLWHRSRQEDELYQELTTLVANKERNLPTKLQKEKPFTGSVVLELLEEYDISGDQIGYFMLDNASANDTAVEFILKDLCPWMKSKQRRHRRLRCLGHVINLCCQAFLMGRNCEKYLAKLEKHHQRGDYTKVEELWKKFGCLGRLHNLVRYIRLTPQRREEFATIIIGGDLSQFDGLELIQNNSTRWNSWFYSITRALNVRERLELFSARHVPGKGSVGIANFKLDGQHWFELEKIELALKDFYAATLLSEGKKTSLADWFSTLDCLLREISETKDHYHDIHTEDDNNFTWKYLQGCADAAWLKCVEYYNNQQLNWQNRFPEDTDLPPAYYAAQILDPYRKWGWFRQEWVLHGDEEKKRWFENAQLAVKHLWETEYKGRYPVEMLPPPARKERDPDPAFDRQREHKRIRIDAPVSTTDLYEQYISTDRLHNEEAGCNEAIAYWLSRYDSQRDLARFALDMFAISPMSDECERLFSSAKLTIVDRRGRLKADIIEACECLRAWYGKPQAEGNSDIEDSENEDD